MKIVLPDFAFFPPSGSSEREKGSYEYGFNPLSTNSSTILDSSEP